MGIGSKSQLWSLELCDLEQVSTFPPSASRGHITSAWWNFNLGSCKINMYRARHSGYCCLIAKSCLTPLWLHRLYHTRLLCPWDFPGKNTGVYFHFFLQGIFLPNPGIKPVPPASAGRHLPLSHHRSPGRVVVTQNCWIIHSIMAIRCPMFSDSSLVTGYYSDWWECCFSRWLDALGRFLLAMLWHS